MSTFPEPLFPGGEWTSLTFYAWYWIAELCIHPYQLSLSTLLSLAMPTTREKEDMRGFIRQACIWTVPLLLLNLCCIPLAVIGGILRVILQPIRSKYIYIHPTTKISVPELKACYTVATINTCLFHEVASRFNNLVDPDGRAAQTGARIIVDQYFYKDMKSNLRATEIQLDKEFTVGVDDHFPHLDFICFQEVWQRWYARCLIAELKKVYPFIVYDVGSWSVKCNYFLFNSGLLFASRYEIIDMDFKPFSDKCKTCVLNSKGLLMVKVHLGTLSDGTRQVGYNFLTHLQAYQGEKQVIDKQLDEVLIWIEEFRHRSTGQDIVKFDVLCGDFNFDNTSPCDCKPQRHKIFEIYFDPCRVKAGVDKEWTIGTEFRQNRLWDPEISTPEGLKDVLSDPIQRQRYMVDGDLTISSIDSIVNDDGKIDEHGNIIISPVGGRRRVDYVLSRKELAIPSSYRYVSRLATLTDHIPVVLTVNTSTR